MYLVTEIRIQISKLLTWRKKVLAKIYFKNVFTTEGYIKKTTAVTLFLLHLYLEI